MKQIFVLDSNEMRQLNSGEQFRISIGGQEIVFMAEKARKTYQKSGDTRKVNPDEAFYCQLEGCYAHESKHPFPRERDLHVHETKMHKKGRKLKAA